MRKQEDDGYILAADKVINLSDKAYNESKSLIMISFTNSRPLWEAHNNTPLELVNLFFSQHIF